MAGRYLVALSQKRLYGISAIIYDTIEELFLTEAIYPPTLDLYTGLYLDTLPTEIAELSDLPAILAQLSALDLEALAQITPISLGNSSIGLTLNSGVLSLPQSGSDLEFSRGIYDDTFKKLNGIIQYQGISYNPYGIVYVDNANNVLFAVTDNGVLVDDIYTSWLSRIPYPNNLDMVYGIQDQEGRILWGVDSKGRTRENSYLSDLPYPNNLDLVYGIQDQEGKILWGVKSNGEVLGVSSNASALSTVALVDGDYLIESKSVNGKLVVYRTKGLQSTRLSLPDLDSVPAQVLTDKIILSVLISGNRKSMSVNRDGTGLFYTGYKPDLFKQTYWHIIGNGQSLSEGQGSTARTINAYSNVMFNSGIKPAPGNVPTSFVPLAEQSTERGNVSMCNLVTGLARSVAGVDPDTTKRDVRFLVSHVGYGARALKYIRKNPVTDGSETTSYADAIAQVTAAKTIAQGLGWGYEVLAMPFHHGESDDWVERSNFPDYATQLQNFWTDYNTDIKAITGQTRDLTMFVTQTSAHQRFFTNPSSSLANYNLFKQYPNRFVLVCPKYWLSYSDALAHLDTNGYNAMGDLVAVAMAQHFLEGKPWKPLYPTSIARSGAVLTVNFNVPVAPLVFDTTNVTNPGNYGFEYVDNSNSPVTINSVVLGNDGVSVIITLASSVPGKLRYAYTATIGAAPGPTSGPRGNLCDSASYQNTYNLLVKNWCVHFEEVVL